MASVPSVPFVAHSKGRRAGIPKHCTVCGVGLLNPHQLTGLCLEDKLIARNERLTVSKSEAA
jgi:hypothetical protein